MTLLFVSFIAGALTVLAPCILPLLPVVIGGSLLDNPDDEKPRPSLRPYIIAGSLAVSVIVFTLLLKATTALLGVPQEVWQIISGVIILTLGLQILFPVIWEKLISATGLLNKSNAVLSQGYKKDSTWGAVIMGAALGPIFNSCSPTYALVVAAVLPTSFVTGLIYIIAYAVGLASMLLLIALLGRKLTARLGWLSDTHGTFKKVLGVLFVIVGLVVIFGLDKKIQAYVLESGLYDPVVKIEQKVDR